MINSVKAMIIVGCTFDELNCSDKFPADTDWNLKLSELGLVSASPYVDGIGESDMIVGLVFSETEQFASVTLIDAKYIESELQIMRNTFCELTTIEPQTYLLSGIT